MVHPSKYAEGRRTSNKMVCRVCLKDHPLRFCKKFLQVNYEERMRLVSIYRYCAGCLSHDHTWRTCESTGRCKRCGDMHHTLLHKVGIIPSSLAQNSPKRLRRGPSSSKRLEHKRPSSSVNSAGGPRSSDDHESERPSSSQALVLSSSKNRNARRRRSTKHSKNLVTRPGEAVSLPLYYIRETILLKPTAIVRLDSNGRFVNERAIIDPSSACSIVSDELVRRISALKIHVGKTERCCLKITGHYGFSMVIESYAEVRRKYTIMAPVKSIDSKVLDEFPGLQLADPQFNISAPPNCSTTTSSSKTKCSNIKTNCRHYSSVHTQQPAGPVREIQIDPYIILDDELKYFYDDVRDLLAQGTSQAELDKIATYYFDGQGKALRPMVTMLMSKAINYHLNKESRQLLHKQRQIALFSEMVHSASLVHDDVIDQSDFRRGKPSVNVLWNHKKVTMAGDFILAVASIMIARLKSDDVTIVLSQILTDLVQGEFMQLGSRETENERFAHYLTKTYRKTASLIANTLKATAVIAEADENLTELVFQYGRNIGLAFQLVDDMLDFVSSAETMGKPTAADLKLGLATAPVLFACEKYPELNPMIMRRFEEPGDVERAFDLVHKSHGLEQTRFLAKKHCIEAIRLSQDLTESPYQKGLQVVADLVINRMK